MKLACWMLLAATPVLAQDGAGFKACRALAEPAARLACYDALSPTDAAAPAAAPPARPGGNFGLEQQQQKSAPEAVESRIEGRVDGWGPKTMFRLANGQVWQVSDDSNAVVSLSNPKVRVRRGALGAFYLEFEASNHSPRVRRIQ
jgi:hypothetical protein